MALSPAQMQASIIEHLPAKTGRSLDEWLAALGHADVTGRPERIAWLKDQGVGHVTAQIIAARADGAGAEYEDGTDGFLQRLFGTADDVRHQRYVVVRDAITSVVPDTTVTVCKGYVGFARDRQFAAIRARGHELEIGLRLPADGVQLHPVRGLGGGSITSAMRTTGELSRVQLRLVADAAGAARR